jgi:capsular exopolysaccharide synthesis family protein
VIGVVLGMLFGISAALIIEHLDTSIGKIEDLESVTKCSVIGVIPYTAVKDKEMKEILRKRKHGIASLLAAHARKGEKADGEVFCRRRFSFRRRVRREDMMERLRSQLVTSYNEGSDFLESFRLLGANVQLAFGEGGRIRRKCILVTSSKAQEGKSLTASNLSIVMAQMGYKTVLIDADLRRAVVHLFFGLKDRRGGLSDVLTGEITLEKAVRTTTDLFLGEMRQEDLLKHPWMDNLHVITAGTAFPNLTYLLNTEKLEAFLQMLRDRYEVILMDSSPVLSVSDTSIIIPKTDGVLLVYRTGVTSRIALRRARRQIESVKGKEMLRGIVLNFVTPDIGSDYYYYYRRGEHYDTERHG